MSGADAALQQAVVAALGGHAALASAVSGIFDGPPARAAFPYVAIGPIVSTDWSHKSGTGREHRLTLSIWDGGGADLHGLMAEAEAALGALPRDLGGHDLVTLVYLRGRIARDADGPSAAILDYRARTLAT